MDVAGVGSDAAEAMAKGFIQHDLVVTALHYETHHVFVFTDGKATGVYSTAGSGTFLLIERVPSDLTKFARSLGKAAGALGGVITAATALEAGLAGWREADARGEPPPMRLLSALESAAPVLVQAGLDWGAFKAGAGACAASGAGSVVAGFCGAAGVVVERSVISFAQGPEAQASYCRGGTFDAAEASAMGFAHTTESSGGCAG